MHYATRLGDITIGQVVDFWMTFFGLIGFYILVGLGIYWSWRGIKRLSQPKK